MYKNRTHLDTATEFTAGGVCNQRCGAGPFQAGAGAGSGSKIFPPEPEPTPAPASRPKLAFSRIRQRIKFFYILV